MWFYDRCGGVLSPSHLPLTTPTRASFLLNLHLVSLNLGHRVLNTHASFDPMPAFVMSDSGVSYPSFRQSVTCYPELPTGAMPS